MRKDFSETLLSFKAFYEKELSKKGIFEKVDFGKMSFPKKIRCFNVAEHKNNDDDISASLFIYQEQLYYKCFACQKVIHLESKFSKKTFDDFHDLKKCVQKKGLDKYVLSRGVLENYVDIDGFYCVEKFADLMGYLTKYVNRESVKKAYDKLKGFSNVYNNSKPIYISYARTHYNKIGQIILKFQREKPLYKSNTNVIINVLNEGEQKHVLPSFAVDNLEYIKKKNNVFIVEGVFDLLSLYTHGVKNCIYTSGVNLSKSFYNFLLNNGINSITLALDNDEAGEKAYDKISREAIKYGIAPYKLLYKEKDLSDFYVKNKNFDKRNFCRDSFFERLDFDDYVDCMKVFSCHRFFSLKEIDEIKFFLKSKFSKNDIFIEQFINKIILGKVFFEKYFENINKNLKG